MTREQAKQNLISIGISEPTDEQVSNYLNQLNGETKKEKDKAAEYKAKADKADELQSKIDEIEAGNLTELEKANKALETANNQIAELQKSNAIRDLREKAMTDFKITAEQAKAVVKEDGSFDTTVLGQIISEKETASAQAKEQEIAKGTPNPGGGGSNQDLEKTEAEKIAASLISSNSSQSNNDVLSHYLGGN
jgi:hypothetical protein